METRARDYCIIFLSGSDSFGGPLSLPGTRAPMGEPFVPRVPLHGGTYQFKLLFSGGVRDGVGKA